MAVRLYWNLQFRFFGISIWLTNDQKRSLPAVACLCRCRGRHASAGRLVFHISGTTGRPIYSQKSASHRVRLQRNLSTFGMILNCKCCPSYYSTNLSSAIRPSLQLPTGLPICLVIMIDEKNIWWALMNPKNPITNNPHPITNKQLIIYH